ncbi:hypothetical protein OAory_01024700 [Aspergillus oryzae]|uniref:Uncharacterized protein n=1 Tax=Aspergillus oryzae TaxID=5062 RepID=A0A1S9DXT4_ASPOZ|nr:hypothetical protein OAory_01024700 [Aspergillus oryzae]
MWLVPRGNESLDIPQATFPVFCCVQPDGQSTQMAILKTFFNIRALHNRRVPEGTESSYVSTPQRISAAWGGNPMTAT